MTQLEFFTSVVKLVWDGMGSINVPFLNIPVTSLFLGVFVASFSIMILRPILGLGGQAFGSVTSSIHSSVSRSRNQHYADKHPKRVEHVHTHYLGGKKQ